MKGLLIVAATWMGPAAARAEPGLELALKAGPNAATLDEPSRFARYGVTGGLAGHLEWPLVDRFSLGGQVELLYTPRGAEAFFDGVYVGETRGHYLDLVVAARPEARFGPASVYLLLGGGLGLLVRADKLYASGMMQDITDDMRRLDVALLVGAGVAWHPPGQGTGPFRLGTVFLEARHDHGLLDSDGLVGGFKNRTSSLMVGLSFAVGSGAAAPRPAWRPAGCPPAPPVAAAGSRD